MGSEVQFIPRVILPVSVSHSQSILASLLFHGSTSLYLTLLASIKATSLHLTLITLQWLYFFILDSTLIFHSSTSLYMTLMPSTIALFDSTLPWLFFTLLDYTLLQSCQPHGMQPSERYQKMSEMEVSKRETCLWK